ncbi:MAG: hypothetical protein COA57_03310 [Flavobacteriales bacterium]|nr:MAG: hypothetical protein COA57_03310 [Flavobacteriales bacterium]
MRFGKLFLLLLLFFSTSVFAQVTANFSASVTQGCSPLGIVAFTNLSTGPVTSSQWNFGQGGGFVLNSDSIVYKSYNASGSYTVTLVVSDGTNYDTLVLSGYIVVFDNPQPAFTSNVNGGCPPLTVTFYNQTILGDTGLSSVLWALSGGVSSTDMDSTTNTYPLTGNYDISLQVTDSNGCSGVVSITDYIQVSQPPVISFTANNNVACDTPLTVNFTNNTTGATSYIWYFGDDSTSTAVNPVHTYDSLGVYNVALVATDASGCSDSVMITNLISIGNPTASFTTVNDSFCVGEAVQFTNLSIGTSSLWDLDGFVAITPNPNYAFSSTGNKIIQLIVYGPGGACTDTLVDSIHIELITANYSTNLSYSCNVPATVQYTDLSTAPSGIVSWEWHFAIGDTVFAQDTAITYGVGYLNPNSLVACTPNQGVFNDTLIATSALGCQSMFIDSIEFFVLQPGFTADQVSGCMPLDVCFTDCTAPFDSIASWSWDFGDPGSGANNTSSLQNSCHQFVNDGDYIVQLTVTDVSGCLHSYNIPIAVGFPPTVVFVVDTDTTCGSLQVQFTDLSTPAANVDQWIWDFGDGGASTVQNPQYTYADTGHMDVQLIVGYNGCYDTLMQDSLLLILGPITNMTTTFSCDSPFVYCVDTIGTIDPTRWEWDWGDGSIDSNIADTCHTYLTTGNYTIQLTAINDSNGCTDSTLTTIFVRDIQSDFTIDTTFGCSPLTVCFNGITSQDAVSYTWNFMDSTIFSGCCLDTTSGAAICHVFDTARGIFNTRLIVSDLNGCRDTAYNPVTVYKPLAAFMADSLYGCVPFFTVFQDTSIFDTTLVTWIWDFGDGVIDTTKVDNTTHSYTFIGNKTITLIIEDTLGCRDTLVKTAYIAPYQPVPGWTVNDATLCDGVAAIFTNTTVYAASNPLSYVWDFGDGTFDSISISPIHVFADTGWFTITLTATDTVLGCDSTRTDSNVIHVQGIPQVNFITPDTLLECYPENAFFVDLSVSDYLASWYWDFGDGNTTPTSIQNPVNTYDSNGYYDVMLIVTTTYGCVDTLVRPGYVRVDGPYAEFSLSPDTVCVGDVVTFTLDTSWNVQFFDWDFDDGQAQINASSPAYHAYSQTGIRNPVLIYYSDSSCPQFDSSNTIFVHQVKAGFTVSDSVGCADAMQITFTDASLSPDTWYWDFDDGSDTTIQSPVHSFNNAGTYNVWLAISNAATGCVDTASQTIVVHPIPVISISNDTIICFGESAQLIASGIADSIYLWSPSASLNFDNVSNPLASPSSTTSYTVLITDTNNCDETATVQVAVQQVPDVTITPYPDTSIIIGQEVPITVSSQVSGVTYSWSPDTWLSCANCTSLVATPLESTEYEVTVADTNGCFVPVDDVYIKVIKEFEVDVPTAFTPNGDGINDIIYVDGWGIKNLIEFKIFNRWGQMVFETTDINKGWDGNYNGAQQNIDSYAYTVQVESYEGEIKPKKGYINLIR